MTFVPATFTRAVDENSGANQNVGSPVTATYTGTCTLTYTLGGADDDSFEIDSSTGQIKTKSGVTYDHEAKSTYTVTVTAYHANCGTDDASVTINVNDVDEPPLAPAEPLTLPVPGAYYSIRVSWTPPDNTGRPDITGYDVSFSGGVGHQGVVSVAGNSVTLTGLVPVNIRYDIRVRAKNEEGDSAWSGIAAQIANGPPFLVDPGDPVIPSGLGTGDIFRLLFVTTYDNDEADTTYYGEYFDRGLQDFYVSRFDFFRECGCPRPAVSTRHFDARIFTDTEYTDDDRGVPIYWVGGGRVAADYADFYDGDWENETSPTDVNGRPYPLLVGPWTGSANDGTELVEGGVSRALGESLVGYGAPGATAPGAGPLHSGSTAANTEVRPLYVLTAPVEVGFSLLVSNRSQYEYFYSDLSAGRSQRFSTGGNLHGYQLGFVTVEYVDPEADPVSVAVYTVNQQGHPDTLVATLEPPGFFHAVLVGHLFRAPNDIVLAAKTIYAVVVRPATSGTTVRMVGTDAAGGDLRGFDDWSIGDAFDIESGGSWEADSAGNALYMEIRGALRVGPSLAPTGLTATAVGRDRIDLSWTPP